MRATENNFYNIKRLHVWMALSSLALLATTIWLVAADHARPWKAYQRTFRDRIEPWMTQSQIARQQDDAWKQQEKELLADVKAARKSVPPQELLDRFKAQLSQDAKRRKVDPPDALDLQKAWKTLSERPSVELRDRLLQRLREHIDAASLREQNADRQLRFRRAEQAELRSHFEAGVGEGLATDELTKQQAELDQLAGEVEQLAANQEDAAEHVRSLEGTLAEITQQEDAAQKALAEHRLTLDRLNRSLAGQRPSAAKDWLQMPLVEALGRPLTIEQIWLPDLTIDYNFREVARFDRCTTCHQGIERTAAGQPNQPAIRASRVLEVRVANITMPDDTAEDSDKRSLGSVLGLTLAEEGILEQRAATIQRVLPRTPAAEAQLMVGDVIVQVNSKTVDRSTAETSLLEAAAAEGPITLQIRRGLPHPYASHPRPDLFVGSLSPHPVSEFGCTICHDGQGSATEFRYASHTPNSPAVRKQWQADHGWFDNHHWDFPMLPRRFAQSRCLKCHHAVTDLEPAQPGDTPAAAKLLAGYHLIRQNGCFGCHEILGYDGQGKSVGPDMRLEPGVSQGLAAEECVTGTPNGFPPGTLRKVGPSLRDQSGSPAPEFLADRIADPKNFLPNGRMPRFFGLHDHLQGQAEADAKRFEPIEIRAIVEYLLGASEPVEPLSAPTIVSEDPSPQRGRKAFLRNGCLACHQHSDFPNGDFPDSEGTQGPELSNLAAKFTGETGFQWLAGWIRDPSRHSPRTLMPNPLLEPVPLPGEQGQNGPKVTDPAADIAAYLLAVETPYEPGKLPQVNKAALDELAQLHLSKTFPRRTAQLYLREGIPQSMAEQVRSDEVELLGQMTQQKKLRYVGRRTIRKRGCFGCHDIPGFETAQPIGPALSEWGRKQESLLAFEQIRRYVELSKPKDKKATDADSGFFHEALMAGRREGFLWQKLRAPRSFDFQKAQNKGYNERLTMGRFNFTAQQREAIMTFVLGLVADPPASKYVYQPDKPTWAIIEGRKVLDKYACASCHTLQMGRWAFEFDPDLFEDPFEFEDHEFLRPSITPQQIAASQQLDARGLGHARVVGMPQVDADGVPVAADDDVDDDDNEAFLYGFSLWEPVAINGMPWAVGGADPLVWSSELDGVNPPTGQFDVRYFGSRLTRIDPPLGGQFARLLFPVVLADARDAGSTAAGAEAWGWGPPPLVGEGAKVQPAWLHQYLLSPYKIRPACVLKMPRYNMSPDEAAKLTDYFAAAAGMEFPYASNPPQPSMSAGVADEAMRMVVDTQTYCAKCHQVGDFDPGGETKTILAPDLERVQGRLRPEYVRRWLASPKAALPYTGMTANFPPTGESVDPDRFPGDSREQLDAAVHLLLNYDRYLSGQVSIRSMIEANMAKEARSSEPGPPESEPSP